LSGRAAFSPRPVDLSAAISAELAETDLQRTLEWSCASGSRAATANNVECGGRTALFLNHELQLRFRLGGTPVKQILGELDAINAALRARDALPIVLGPCTPLEISAVGSISASRMTRPLATNWSSAPRSLWTGTIVSVDATCNVGRASERDDDCECQLRKAPS